MSELIRDGVLEQELYRLITPQAFISSEDCEAGCAYWVDSSSIGSIAICVDSDWVGMEFRGIKEVSGRYYLSNEHHKDYDPSFGTVYPYIELGEAPDSDDESTMRWLLDLEIEVSETKIEWLTAMPKKYTQLLLHDALVGDEICILDAKELLKREGFKGHELPSPRQISNRFCSK